MTNSLHSKETDGLFDFFRVFFALVALLALAMMLGGVWLVHLLLTHFGVIA